MCNADISFDYKNLHNYSDKEIDDKIELIEDSIKTFEKDLNMRCIDYDARKKTLKKLKDAKANQKKLLTKYLVKDELREAYLQEKKDALGNKQEKVDITKKYFELANSISPDVVSYIFAPDEIETCEAQITQIKSVMKTNMMTLQHLQNTEQCLLTEKESRLNKTKDDDSDQIVLKLTRK